jgi:hypothetical protein
MLRRLVRSEIRRLIVTDESLNREGSLEQDSRLVRLNVGHRALHQAE